MTLAFVHCASRSESLRPLSPVHGPRQSDQRRAVLPVLRKLGSQELGAPCRVYPSAPTPPGSRLLPRWRFAGAASAHCAKPAKDAPGRGHSDGTRPRMHSRLGQGTCLDPWRAAPTPPGPSCSAGGVFGAAGGNCHSLDFGMFTFLHPRGQFQGFWDCVCQRCVLRFCVVNTLFPDP